MVAFEFDAPWATEPVLTRDRSMEGIASSGSEIVAITLSEIVSSTDGVDWRVLPVVLRGP